MALSGPARTGSLARCLQRLEVTQRPQICATPAVMTRAYRSGGLENVHTHHSLKHTTFLLTVLKQLHIKETGNNRGDENTTILFSIYRDATRDF